MKKIQTVPLALLAVFAFGTVLVASASAETTLPALWLANGNTVTANLNSETAVNILLEDSKAPLVGKAAYLCSEIFDGTIGAEGADEIKEVLNLKKELISALGGLGLSSANGDCSNETNCGTPIEVWPVGLPWPTKLVIMENGETLDIIEKSGYEILCTTGGLNVEDTCTAASTGIKVENDPATGDASSAEGATASPNASCTLSKETSGVNTVDELTEIKLAAPSEELLTVSAE